MTTYTIDTENNITAFGSAKESEAGPQGESFTRCGKYVTIAAPTFPSLFAGPETGSSG